MFFATEWKKVRKQKGNKWKMCGNVGQYQFEGDTFVAVFVKNVKGLCVCVCVRLEGGKWCG